MIALGTIERRVRESADLSVIEAAYLHRATTEDAMGRTRGRDRIRERRLAQVAQDGCGAVRIVAEADGFLAFETAAGWRGHRWAVRDGDHILSETEIVDGRARAAALRQDADTAARELGRDHPLHAPLGELRAGRGQLATPADPDLPPGFPVAAVPAVRWLHRFWNARALDRAPQEWSGPADARDDARGFALTLLAALPDAVCLIERGMVVGDRIALLWRLHGHHLGTGFGEPTARRVRLIGSSLIALDGDRVVAEDMMIDLLAFAATRYRPAID